MFSSLSLQSASGAPPLRIGLLLDSRTLPACFAEVVSQIAQSSFACLELLILNDGKTSRRASGSLLYSLYERWDRRFVQPSTDPLAPIDCSPQFERVESFSVASVAGEFPADALRRICGKSLDVLIRFGFDELRGGILTAARCGVWSYRFGDGEPPFFREAYEGSPVAEAVLEVLAEDPMAAHILCKGVFEMRSRVSLALNRPQPYWGGAPFVIQKLRELHEHGWERLDHNAASAVPGPERAQTAPSNWTMLKWLAPALIGKSLRRISRRPAAPHWRLAIRTGGPRIPDSHGAPDLHGFSWIESPPDRFFADPFLLEHEGKTWLFFEDYEYGPRLGRLSCAELRDGKLGEPIRILEKPYHLSYPCVFRDAGELYMIPETGGNRTVELYRSVRFPNQWELVRELFHGWAVDTTPWIEGGLYWFFTTLREPRGLATQLWLFSSPTLIGEWTPHPASPLSLDVRNNRGAGAIFRHNGRLFRPSQDGSGNYGRSFTLNEIVTLDRNHYREEPRVTVEPTWDAGLLGTHTYAHHAGIEILDACSLRRIPPAK